MPLNYKTSFRPADDESFPDIHRSSDTWDHKSLLQPVITHSRSPIPAGNEYYTSLSAMCVGYGSTIRQHGVYSFASWGRKCVARRVWSLFEKYTVNGEKS